VENFPNAQGGPVVLRVIAAVRDNAALLSEIDGAIGDGDHGINMSKGFTAVADSGTAAASSRDAEGAGFLGATRVLARRPLARPHTHEPRRTLNPRVACLDKWSRSRARTRFCTVFRSVRSGFQVAMNCSAMRSSASPGVMGRSATCRADRSAAAKSAKTRVGRRQESSSRAHVCASSRSSACRARAMQVRREAREIQPSTVRSSARAATMRAFS
jgi:hypothetical protein